MPSIIMSKGCYFVGHVRSFLFIIQAPPITPRRRSPENSPSTDGESDPIIPPSPPQAAPRSPQNEHLASGQNSPATNIHVSKLKIQLPCKK